jgi:hypothetical protein
MVKLAKTSTVINGSEMKTTIEPESESMNPKKTIKTKKQLKTRITQGSTVEISQTAIPEHEEKYCGAVADDAADHDE